MRLEREAVGVEAGGATSAGAAAGRVVMDDMVLCAEVPIGNVKMSPTRLFLTRWLGGWSY
jgi:hypothetical protein